MDWFQIGKGVCQGYIFCQLAYLTYMQSTSCKKHKLESRLPGEKAITSDMQMTPTLWQKARRTKCLLMKVKEESEKASLKL